MFGACLLQHFSYVVLCGVWCFFFILFTIESQLFIVYIIHAMRHSSIFVANSHVGCRFLFNFTSFSLGFHQFLRKYTLDVTRMEFVWRMHCSFFLFWTKFFWCERLHYSFYCFLFYSSDYFFRFINFVHACVCVCVVFTVKYIKISSK